MKKNNIEKMKQKLLIKIGISLILVIVLCYLFFVVILDGLLNNLLANILYDINIYWYYYIVNHKIEFITITYLLISGIVIYYQLSKFFNYMNTIFDSIDNVFKKDSNLIILPTDCKEIEDKLNNIKYNYLKSEQLAKTAESNKNDLIMYMAHDLKTPLTSVIGYLTLLEEEEDNISKDSRKKYTAISLNKSKRLEELINEFFEITRFNLQDISIEKQSLNLSYLLNQLVDEFYPLLEPKHLQCQLNIPENLSIQADSDKLARVFDNLFRNAINYSYENTVIFISVILTETILTIHFKNSGNQIPEHKLNKIFEKFYRVDDSRSSSTGGAGLGLAIAKQIIELHGGTIQVTSDTSFTEFMVSLPL